MAVKKLSQITSGGTYNPSTDYVVTVRSGTTDVLTTFTGSGYVPYTGATGNVNLGSYNLTANGVSIGLENASGGATYQGVSINAGGNSDQADVNLNDSSGNVQFSFGSAPGPQFYLSDGVSQQFMTCDHYGNFTFGNFSIGYNEIYASGSQNGFSGAFYNVTPAGGPATPYIGMSNAYIYNLNGSALVMGDVGAIQNGNTFVINSGAGQIYTQVGYNTQNTLLDNSSGLFAVGMSYSTYPISLNPTNPVWGSGYGQLLINGGTGWNASESSLSVYAPNGGTAIAADFEGEVDIGNGGYTDPSPGQTYDLKLGGANNGFTSLGACNSNGGWRVNNVTVIDSAGDVFINSGSALYLISGALVDNNNTSGSPSQVLTAGVSGSSALWQTAPLVLNSYSINAKTVANTAVYTVPSGKTLQVTGIIVRCTAATSITVPATAGVGNASGTNNIAASTSLTSLTATTATYIYTLLNAGVTVTSGNKVYFNLGTAATGTSQSIAVDVIGYLH